MAVTNLSIQVKTNASEAASSLKRLQAALNDLKASCGTYNINFTSNSAQAVSKIKSELSGIQTAAAQAQTAVDQLGAPNLTGTTSVGSTVVELEEESTAAREASSAISELSAAETSAGGSSLSLSSILSGVKSALSLLGSAAKGAAGIALSGIKSMLSSIGEKASKMINPIKSLASSMWRLTKLRIMRGILRAITTGLSEGTKNLYYYSQALNGVDASHAVNTLNSLSTATQYLKNSIGAAFSSILATIMPVINAIVNAIVTVINYINMLFAILGGRSTYTKALEVGANYADAAAGSTGSAADSAEDLKATLLGIDEINKLDDADSGSGGSGGGGGGGAGGYGSMFEEAAIESDLLNALKDALNHSDWTELGELVAEKLNSVIYSIQDWLPKFEEACKLWGKRIATLLNGIIDGLDWAALGQTIKGFINAVLDGLNEFIDNFDFGRLGEQIGTLLTNALGDASMIKKYARYITKKLQGMFETAISAIKTSSLGKLLGKNLSALFNSAYEYMDNSGGELIGTLMNQLAEMIGEAVKGLNVKSAVTKMFDNINKAIRTFNVSSVTSAIKAVFEKAVEAAQTIFDNLPETLSLLIPKLVQAIVEWAPAIIEGIGDLVSNIVSNLPTLLGSILNYISTDFGIDLVSVVGSIGTSLLSAVGGVVDSILGWFGVDSDIAGAIKSFGEVFSDMANTVTRRLNELKEANEETAQAAAKIYLNAQEESTYYTNLAGELQTIVDKNGKIKTGYEDRAQYILSELSHAYDFEYEVVGGVIQQYDELINTIYDSIAIRQKEAQLEAEKEYYDNAKENLDAAMDCYSESADKVETWSNTVQSLTEQVNNANGANSTYLAQSLAVAHTQLSKAEGDMEEASTMVDQYTSQIIQYESDMAAFDAKNYDAMSDSLSDYLLKTSSSTAELEATYEERKTYLQDYHDSAIRLYEQTGDEVYATEAASYANQLVQLDTYVNEHYQKLMAKALNDENLSMQDAQAIADGYGGFEAALAAIDNMEGASTEKLLELVESFNAAGGDMVTDYAGSIGLNAPAAVQATTQMGTDSLNALKDTTGVEDCGADIVAGYAGSIELNAPAAVQAATQMGTGTIDALKDSTGCHSPSKLTQEIGADFDEGLYNGISKNWSKIETYVEKGAKEILNALSNSWSSIASETSSSWSNIASSLQSTMSSLKSQMTTTFSSIKSDVNTSWSSIKSTITTAVTSIKSSVSTGWSSIKSTVTTAMTSIKSSVSTGMSSIKSTMSSAWSSMKSTTSSAWSSMKSTVVSAASGIKSGVKTSLSSLGTSAYTWGKDICVNMASGINANKYRVTSAASSVASSIKSYVGFSEPETGPLSDFHTYMPDMLKLMASGIRSNASLAINEVASLSSGIAAAAQNIPELAFGNIDIGGGNITFSGDAEMSDDLDGIAEAIYTTGAENTKMLQSVESLLTQLLAKDATAVIKTSDITNGFNRANRRAGRTIVSVG